MKKFIYSMFVLAVSAFTFTSCEDVPAPYAQPGHEDPVVIDPTGSGTLDDPYNVAAVLDYVNGLAADAESPQDVYVKGKVVSVTTNYNESEPQFGNAVFYISDDGTSTKQFYVYRALYLGNKKYTSGATLQKGDEVIICGKVVNYKGTTPETVQGKSYLYSLNGVTGEGGEGGEGKGTGTQADPYNPVAAANAVKDLTWTSNTDYQKTGEVYVKGKISRIADKGTFTDGGTYGNASFYISEDGSENGEFYCFRILYLGNVKYASGQTDIKVGDDVVICGKLMNYRGNTPETVAGEAYLYSLNGVTEGGSGGGGGGGESGGTAKGTGTLNDPYNAVAAANAVKDLTWTSNTEYDKTGDVYVKGKISRIANNGTFTGGGTYGNATFYISEDGSQTDEFQCYRILYLENTKYNEYTGEKVDIKVGDEVIICGKLMNYRGNTPETVANEAYLYSLNGKTEGGSGGGGNDGGGNDGGGDTGGNSASFATNSGAQTWAAATDATYGSGFSTTTQGMNIGYYKHTSSTAPVATNENHVRVYKNSALSITAPEGKKFKKIVIGCAPNAGTSSYCFDMTGLEGGANATADKSALTVTWSGSANKVVLHANNGQVRVEKLTVVFE